MLLFFVDIISFLFPDMEKGKKRKVDSQCRQFNDEWKIKYFFVKANDKALCLICRDSVAVLKECNIRRHYKSNHGSSYSHITGAERTKKFESFQHSLHSQQAVFSKKNLKMKLQLEPVTKLPMCWPQKENFSLMVVS